MMTKERLRAYREQHNELEQLRRQLELAEGEALREHYRDKLAGLEREQLEIERAIERLDARERTLIRHYYMEGLTWEEVCTEIGYAWSQTHRIHAGALEKLRAAEKSRP